MLLLPSMQADVGWSRSAEQGAVERGRDQTKFHPPSTAPREEMHIVDFRTWRNRISFPAPKSQCDLCNLTKQVAQGATPLATNCEECRLDFRAVSQMATDPRLPRARS